MSRKTLITTLFLLSIPSVGICAPVPKDFPAITKEVSAKCGEKVGVNLPFKAEICWVDNEEACKAASTSIDQEQKLPENSFAINWSSFTFAPKIECRPCEKPGMPPEQSECAWYFYDLYDGAVTRTIDDAEMPTPDLTKLKDWKRTGKTDQELKNDCTSEAIRFKNMIPVSFKYCMSVSAFYKGNLLCEAHFNASLQCREGEGAQFPIKNEPLFSSQYPAPTAVPEERAQFPIKNEPLFLPLVQRTESFL